MSCAIVIVPAVMAAWPVLMPILSAAVSACGFSALCRAHAAVERMTPKARRREEEVELPLDQSQVLAEAMQRDTTFTATKGNITVRLSRDTRGQLRVCASGVGVPKQTLQEEAQAVTNRVVQQYAYHKLMTELQERGFQVVSETATEDHRIRLRVRRFA